MKTTPRSQLLLVELICDLVIFAICAIVCVTLLVQARLMSQESTQLTDAVYVAQTAAETYLAGGESGGDYLADGTLAVNYGDYEVLLIESVGTATVNVYVKDGSAPVYTLTLERGA